MQQTHSLSMSATAAAAAEAVVYGQMLTCCQ